MIKTTVNNEEKEIEQIRLPDGRYVDYVDVKVGDNYQRVFTSTRTIKKNTDTKYSYKSLDNEDSTLKNYRIYGQTSRNLFDITSFFNSITSCTHGTWSHSSNYFTIDATANDAYLNPFGGNNAYKIAVFPNTTYTLSFDLSNSVDNAPSNIIIAENGLIQSGYMHQTGVAQKAKYTITTRNDAEFVTFRFGVSKTDTSQTFSHIMFNQGSTALPYEPYGESVGDLVTSGEHAGEYKVPVTISNGADSQTIPIYLPEQIKKVGDEAEYVDYAEQKWHRVRKNLLENTATSQTINGVTFTVNGDRSVTCSGTATQTAVYILNNTFSLEPGTYNLTGCPAGGGYTDKYKLDVVVPPIAYGTDKGDGSSFTLSSTLTNAQYRIIIYAGQKCNNLTFYPMIRKADIEDDTYEPYIENTEVDVTLPALPTIAGTNVLSVGTEVRPSVMEVKGHIKNY